jgi:endoglucanase
MKKTIAKSRSILAFALLIIACHFSVQAQNNIVDRYGRLTARGNYIIGENGDTVQLRGMSFFWSQWMPQFYNESCVKWLKEDWKCTIVRAAMGVEKGGYLTNPEQEKETAMKLIDAAIAQGLYVIIDYHAHEAHMNTDAAITFFTEMAQKYGKYPHVIYELYNEPLAEPNWSRDLKPYGEKVLQAIRKHDPDNLVIMGTRQWSQKVTEAANDPIKDVNLAYALHFYPHTHRDWLRAEAKAAMDKGIALFVSEMGTCDASGNKNFNPEETKKWLDFLDQYKISWCNWSVCDKEETASVLKPGASDKGNWQSADLTESGTFIRNEIRKKNTTVFTAGIKKKKK